MAHRGKLLLVLALLALSGCIYTQTGFVRNDTDRTVFVGRPGGSSYSKISAHDTAETRFVFCLEISTNEESRYYGVPQVSGGVYVVDGVAGRADAPASAVPADAYREGGPLYDVSLVVTDDGLFFDSASEGLVPVRESEKCSENGL